MRMSPDEIKDEKALVNRIYREIEGPPSPKKKYKFVNLANKDFKGIWTGWFRGETPPKLEVDMILVFEDSLGVIDDAFIVGVEVKHFKKLPAGFYEGIGQVLSYSIFGFDGLSLWHLFPEDVDASRIRSFAKASQEVIDGLKLPVFYLCGQFKIYDDEAIGRGLRVRPYAPDVDTIREVQYFVDWTLSSLLYKEKRNPLLSNYRPLSASDPNEIRKRRKTLKVILGIP